MTINRRRHYFINKDYQTRFILRFAVITTICSIASVVLFSWFAGKRLENQMYSIHLSVASADELLLPSVLAAEGIALVVYLLLLAYAVHDLGKRISAPLYMLRKDIMRISAGDLAIPVSLRPGDEFQDLAAHVDGMRKELGVRFARIKEAQQGLARSVSGMERAYLKGRPLTDHVGETRKAVERIKEAAGVFSR